MDTVLSLQPTSGPDAVQTSISPRWTAQATWSPFDHAPFRDADRPVHRYQIEGPVGGGGMGVLLRAWDTALGREVALKTQWPDDGDRPKRTVRFGREAWVMGQLQHPNILSVYDAGRLPDGRPFLALPLVHGVTLKTALDARRSPAVDRDRWVRVFADVCRAVGYAHTRGVVHRDLKPANVLIAEDDRPLLIDWGLARSVRDPWDGLIDVWRPQNDRWIGAAPGGDLTDPHSAIGTPGFAPPEQACGRADVADPRADVFGLGAVLCSILTGAAPFEGADRSELWRRNRSGDVTPVYQRLDRCGAGRRLVALAKRCLHPDPAARPRDGAAVVAALAETAAGPWRRAVHAAGVGVAFLADVLTR